MSEISCCPPLPEAGRKSGERRGNGETARALLSGVVPVPAGLLRRMRSLNSECLRLLLYLMLAQWEVGRPGPVIALRTIAEGAGLSVEMAEAWLVALAENGWVERSTRGFRLRLVRPEEWDPD